jgi:hypothetical protein
MPCFECGCDGLLHSQPRHSDAEGLTSGLGGKELSQSATDDKAEHLLAVGISMCLEILRESDTLDCQADCVSDERLAITCSLDTFAIERTPHFRGFHVVSQPSES